MEDHWIALYGYLVRPFIKYANEYKRGNLNSTIIFIRDKLLGYIENIGERKRS